MPDDEDRDPAASSHVSDRGEGTEAELSAVVERQQQHLENLSWQLREVEREVRPYVDRLKRQADARTEEVRARNRQIGSLTKQLRIARKQLDAIYRSRWWRLGKRIQKVLGRGRPAVGVATPSPDEAPASEPPVHIEPTPDVPSIASIPLTDPAEKYRNWMLSNDPTEDDLARMRAAVEGFTSRPLISIITPVFNTPEDVLRAALDSVLGQAYPDWELIAVDDGSGSPDIRRTLESYVERDERIHVTYRGSNDGISAASADGLAKASGAFVTFLDHDDVLAPDALYEVARVLEQDGAIDVVYSDEDKIEGDRRLSPFFKPDWCPNLLLSLNYINHLCVIRRSLLESVGGFRPGFDGAQDHDVLLRVTERTKRIAHIPKVLYHWRKIEGSAAAVPDAKPHAYDAARRALEDALTRRQTPGSVQVLAAGRYRVRYEVRGKPLVTIIIPTRDRVDLLKTCVESIQERSTYRGFELLVVDNESREPATLDFLSKIEEPHRVFRSPGRFNWQAINNAAAAHARGDHLLFLNNDVEVIEPGWLEAMLELSQQEDVGAVGAKLLYRDGRIQHAGVVVGIGDVAAHAFRGLRPSAVAYRSFTDVVREYSAVTGACLMTRRSVFTSLGGFDEGFRVDFGDVDYCLRARERGFLVVYTPFAQLYHYEGLSRGRFNPIEDILAMRRRWGALILEGDPCYNPNLSISANDFRMRP